jgi:RNA 2',3'-cyclic 3'-phosphodiesterase
MPEYIRAFIAVELPVEIKNNLRECQARLQSSSGNQVKWVDPEIIHLTLKFMGNINVTDVNPVTTAMLDAAVQGHSFKLQIQNWGAFPNLNRVQVIWVGLGGDLAILLELQKNLENNLAKLGFVTEARPFAPHLTLGRVRDTASSIDKQNIGKAIAALKVESILTFPVISLNLMQSKLRPQGPEYTCLKLVKLPA